MKPIFLSCLCLTLLPVSGVHGEERAPDIENLSYGPHERNVLDIWKGTGKNTPVLFLVHGGSWLGGDKRNFVYDSLRKTLEKLLNDGITVVSVNYRFSSEAPLPAPIHDAARALQFIRYKAEELGIDKTRVIAWGSSAGGATACWMATHDDLADPQAEDPVLRESTRLSGAYAEVGQTTIDPAQIKEWFGAITVNHHMISRAAGFRSQAEVEAGYEQAKGIYREFSAVNHLDKNDPPIFLSYRGSLDDPKDPIHHAIFGDRFKKRANELGAPCIFKYRGSTETPPPIDWERWMHEIFADSTRPAK